MSEYAIRMPKCDYKSCDVQATQEKKVYHEDEKKEGFADTSNKAWTFYFCDKHTELFDEKRFLYLLMGAR